LANAPAVTPRTASVVSIGLVAIPTIALPKSLPLGSILETKVCAFSKEVAFSGGSLYSYVSSKVI